MAAAHLSARPAAPTPAVPDTSTTSTVRSSSRAPEFTTPATRSSTTIHSAFTGVIFSNQSTAGSATHHQQQRRDLAVLRPLSSAEQRHHHQQRSPAVGRIQQSKLRPATRRSSTTPSFPDSARWHFTQPEHGRERDHHHQCRRLRPCSSTTAPAAMRGSSRRQAASSIFRARAARSTAASHAPARSRVPATYVSAANELTVGSNNLSTEVSGTINDGSSVAASTGRRSPRSAPAR